MPEYLKALFVVIVLATIVFAVLARPARRIIGAADFRAWRNLWFAVTLVAFLAGNFWIYAVVTGLVVSVVSRREPLRPALYLLLLLAVPQFSHAIPGFGIINYFFYLTHDRLLALVILLPAFLSQVTAARNTRSIRSGADRILLLYFTLIVVLIFRGTTITDTLRDAVMLFLGMLLPYFAFSRSLLSHEDIRRTMLAYLLPILVFAVLGAFETTWDWRLYVAMKFELSGGVSGIGYLFRAGSLRATTTAPGAIVFGYTMLIGLGFLLAFSKQYLSRQQRILAFAVVVLGLTASLSRGPWVGALVLALAFLATGSGQLRTVARFGFFFAMALTIISQTAMWNTIVGLIPFIGEVEAGNVDYRVRLIENAWTVIQGDPWFGSVDFRATEEMQSMIQGQGIVDIVNSYIGVALAYGLVGLALFVGFFTRVIRDLRKAYRSLPAEEEELRRTGRALFATLVSVLVTIGTVSSIGTIPMLYWSLAGIAVAYSRVVRRTLADRGNSGAQAVAANSSEPFKQRNPAGGTGMNFE